MLIAELECQDYGTLAGTTGALKLKDSLKKISLQIVNGKLIMNEINCVLFMIE